MWAPPKVNVVSHGPGKVNSFGIGKYRRVEAGCCEVDEDLVALFYWD